MTKRSKLERQSEIYLKPRPEQSVDHKIMAMLADFVIRRLPGQRILEMGVGGQVWTPRLVERFPDVTTVDASDRLLDEMRRTLAGKPWTPVGALFEEYAPAEPFDTVLSSMVLEHVEDPATLLERVRQSWLDPGGHIAVLVPHALSLHRRLAVTMGIAQHPGELGPADLRLGHKRCFTYQELEELLIATGYKIVERIGLYAKPFPNSLMMHCTEEQLRGAFGLGLELPIEYAATIYYLAQPL